MVWVLAIIAGLVIGWIINAIMRGRGSIWTDLIVGIIGGVVGQWFFGSVLGIGSTMSAGSFALMGILWGVIGAVVLITIVRAIMGAYGEEAPAAGRAYHEEIRRRKDDSDEDDKMK